MSVMSKQHSSVVVQMLHDTMEPKGWEKLDVGCRTKCELRS